MAIVQRTLKILAALFASNVIALVTQLLLPPIFLHRYGASVYGEWLALSAAVAYLSTLNFGIQTFVNQDLTVRYHRGDLLDYHVRQSTALRLLIGIACVAALLATIVFLLPAAQWLGIKLSQRATSITLYFLALQILVGIIFNYLAGTFMVIGKAHRGYTWQNAQRLAATLVTASLAWLHLDFPILASAQFLVLVVGLTLVLIDLRRSAPDIYPSLRHWDRSAIGAILRPSGHFALIFSCTFLVFQLPVLILQKMLGPVAVVGFTLMRTIFSMARQLLAALTQSMGPEITRLYGQRDWPNLSRLYSYSERTVFSLIPVVNLGAFFAAPALLSLWLRKPAFFSLWPYVLCAAISTVMSAKEHKYQFQFSTNTHESLARMMFLTYLGMVAAAIPSVLRFGLIGFLIDWLLCELLQFAYIVRLNVQLFAHTGVHELRYLVRLALLSGAGFLAAPFLMQRELALPIPWQAVSALALMASLLASAVPLFRLDDVARKLMARSASA